MNASAVSYKYEPPPKSCSQVNPYYSTSVHGRALWFEPQRWLCKQDFVSTMGLSTSDGLTVRISNLPPETDGNDVRRFFDGRVGRSGTVISKNGIGHIVTQAKRKTKQTTVTFITHDIKKKAIERCDKTQFSAERGDGWMIVDVEDDFMGLTTLYMPASGTPNLE